MSNHGFLVISNYLERLNYKSWFIAFIILFLRCLIIFWRKFDGNYYIILISDSELLNLDAKVGIINFIFTALLLLIAIRIFSWASYYIIGRQNLEFFYYTFIGFVLSIRILLLRNSLFWIFLGWEGLGVSSFLLIVFFQNWMRINRGLLTLLTNRFGDSLLLIVFCYWILRMRRDAPFNLSLLSCCIFRFLCFTKSAQWPFIRWLPAAIAAPTPVRALVHRSTLVTAGIWLLLSFSLRRIYLSKIWILFGSITLTVARLSALTEIDAKKVVALSTLRQLGLLLFRLGTCSSLICFFHIIMHALAKANLFIVVGSALHHVNSEQDARKLISPGTSISRGAFVRTVSLRGLCFMAGFYSKEIVLGYSNTVMTNLLSVFIYIIFIRTTLTYCLVLIARLSGNNSRILSSKTNPFSNKPIIILSITTIIIGWSRANNSLIRTILMSPSILFYILIRCLMVNYLGVIGAGFKLQGAVLIYLTFLKEYKYFYKNITPGVYETSITLLRNFKKMQYFLRRLLLTISLFLYILL